MARLAGGVEFLAGGVHPGHILGIDRLQDFRGGVVQPMREGDEARLVGLDGFLDVLGVLDACDLGRVQFAARGRHDPAGQDQKVGRLDEDDRLVPDGVPILVGAGPFVLGAVLGADEADGTPEEIRRGVDFRVHQVLDGGGDPDGRIGHARRFGGRGGILFRTRGKRKKRRRGYDQRDPQLHSGPSPWDRNAIWPRFSQPPAHQPVYARQVPVPRFLS